MFNCFLEWIGKKVKLNSLNLLEVENRESKKDNFRHEGIVKLRKKDKVFVEET